MWRAKTLTAFVLFCGCSAQMVNPPSGGQGLIKYATGGAAPLAQRLRDDAATQMSQACGGAYRVDAEGPRVEGQTVVVMPVGAMYVGTAVPYDWWYVQFSCLPAHQHGTATAAR